MPPNSNASHETPGGVNVGPINAAIITEQRLKMRALGYNPMPVKGKAPSGGWEKLFDATEHEIPGWARMRPAETNTGALTRNHPAFDIDIFSSSEAAQAVENLLAEELSDRGRVMVRTGLAPKRAVLCRTTEPFKKIKVELDSFFTDPVTGEVKYDAIEVLGDGQQIVCLGVHPDTGRPFEWSSGAPTYVKASDLPLITEADARAIVDKIIVMLGERFGINVHTPAKATTRPEMSAADAKTTSRRRPTASGRASRRQQPSLPRPNSAALTSLFPTPSNHSSGREACTPSPRKQAPGKLDC
jgi:hypothetical protein